jgi:hypothetical protein
MVKCIAPERLMAAKEVMHCKKVVTKRSRYKGLDVCRKHADQLVEWNRAGILKERLKQVWNIELPD